MSVSVGQENYKRRSMLDFFRDRRAGLYPFMAIAAIPLVAMIGIGTDTARAYLVKSRLSSAIDAAGLAGGRSFYLETRDADIQMFFDANFPDGFMGAEVTGPTILVDQANERLEITATASIGTTLMSVLGQDEVTVTAFAEIQREQVALDVVLAIDMSGSMGNSAVGGGTRIAAARTAATTLVDVLFGADATKEFLNIGLVPWNSKVNVRLDSTTYDDALTTTSTVPAYTHPVTGDGQSEVIFINNSPVPLFSDPGPDWTGCVFQRYLDDGVNDNDADVRQGTLTLNGTDWPAWEPIGPEGDPQPGSTDCDMNVNGSECGRCLSHGITPLTSTKQTITDAISALMSPTGQTNIAQGLGWAWRVLTPEAPFTEAVANPTYRREQALVLLTDGQNWGGSGDGYKTVFGLGSGAGAGGMNARLTELANTIKSQGIIVYVVQFAFNDSTLQTLLRTAASGPDAPFYHFAPGAAELEQVFREVANDLTELRLSK